MKRAIITYAYGAHEELLHIAKPTFREFANRHGYDLLIGKKLTDMPPAWNKVFLLLDALQYYDTVVWLDCDLVIVDYSKDFPALPTILHHSLVRHFEAFSEVPNSGVWIVTRAIIPLLQKMLELEVFYSHGWWEQAALMTMMGYTVPPQGSDFDAHKCKMVFPTKWWLACNFMRVEWNCHPNYRVDRPKIVHCSYPDMLQRIEVMSTLVKDPTYAYPRYKSRDDKPE